MTNTLFTKYKNADKRRAGFLRLSVQEGWAIEDNLVLAILQYGAVEDLDYLLDFDVPLQRANEMHWNSFPLGELVETKKFSFVIMLLDNGVEPKGHDHHGRDLALLACDRNYESLVFAILPRLLLTGIPHSSLLNSAVTRGSTAITKYLIELDTDVNVVLSMYRSPLHLACWNGHLDIARLLLQHGANVHSVDQSGRTALHYAAESGYIGIIHLLIEYGAVVQCQDDKFHTPFYYAAMKDRGEVIEYLDPSGDKIRAFRKRQEVGQFVSLLCHCRIETI